MRRIPSIGERKRTKNFKILSIAAVVLCLISLLLPWVRFEVKTDNGSFGLGITEEQLEDIRQNALDTLNEDEFFDPGSFAYAAKPHLKKTLDALMRILRSGLDSQLSPTELAVDLSNAGTVLKEGRIAAKYAVKDELGYSESVITQDLLDSYLADSIGLKVDLSEIHTAITVGTILAWLIIAVVVGLGGYGIYAAIADKKNLMWVLTAVYGVLVVACCIFAIRMNALVSTQLKAYSFLPAKTINPFHVLIWPILGMLCLMAATVEEYALLSRCRIPTGTFMWTCTCGRRNRNSDKFCAGCGRMRGGLKVDDGGETKGPEEPPKRPEEHHYCRKCGQSIPMGKELCDRCSYAERVSHSESASYGSDAHHSGGEPGKLKVHLGSKSASGDTSSVFTPPKGLD